MPVAKTEVLSKYILMKRKGIISHVGKSLVCAEQGGIVFDARWL